jgi:O-Antigen ligase
VSILERVSKIAAIASILLLLLLLLAYHPDLTRSLRALTLIAIIVGLLVPTRLLPSLDVLWIVLAMLSPGVLRGAMHREGPVLDLFWMAGLSASLLRTAPWSQWTLPPRWRVFAGGWALTLALAWPVLMGREVNFDPHVLVDDGAINSWGMLSAPQVVAWLLYVVWTQLLGLLWLEAIWREFSDTRNRVPLVVHGIWIGATIASLVAVYQGTIDLGVLSTPFWANLARATGTLLDANAFGMCAALAGPLAYLALRDLHGRVAALPKNAAVPNAIALLVFVINLAGLWMSGSRVATLCTLVGTTVFVVAVWWSLGARARRRLLWSTVGVVALVVTVVTTASNAVGPARRIAEIPASLRSGLSTIFARGPYGPIATQMVREHPLVGVGVSSYQILAPDYWRRLANDQLPFDNAQNWWRHQLAEYGIAGSVVPFMWSALIAWHLVTGRARQGRQLEATIVRGLVGAIGVSSFIQVPTQTPIVMLSFMLLLAWSAAMMPTDALTEKYRQWGWAAVTALALLYAGGQLVLARGPLAVGTRALRAEREYAAGTYPPESVADIADFRWTRGNARFVWPARTRWLVVRVWAQHPDMPSTPVRVTLNTPCGVLLNEALSNPTPVSIGVTLPDGQKALEARLLVSRTWRPSDHGSNDERDLGAAIVAEFVDDPSLAVAQNRAVTLKACGAGGI